MQAACSQELPALSTVVVVVVVVVVVSRHCREAVTWLGSCD